MNKLKILNEQARDNLIRNAAGWGKNKLIVLFHIKMLLNNAEKSTEKNWKFKTICVRQAYVKQRSKKLDRFARSFKKTLLFNTTSTNKTSKNKRIASPHHFKKNTSDAPQVHAVGVVAVGQQTLWRSVPPRADVLRVRLFTINTSTGTEVGQL